MNNFFMPIRLDSADITRQNCYRYLQEHWDFKSELIHRLVPKSEYLAELRDELALHGLPEIETASIFSRGPLHKQPIHIDTIDPGWTINKTNLYIPIINDGGRIVWFDPSKGKEFRNTANPKYNSNGKITRSLEQKYFRAPPEIGYYDQINPVILNTTIPHRAESGIYPRAALSMRLVGQLDLFQVFQEAGLSINS